jgi:serine/threonine-protein kinase RsbW
MTRSDIIQLDLPATYQYLNLLGALFPAILEPLQVADLPTLAYTLQLAVHEACLTIINHAYKGGKGDQGRLPITITLAPCAQRLIIDLPHRGHSLDLSNFPFNCELQQAEYCGLFVLSKLMDEVIYQSQEGAAWRSQAGGAWQAVSVMYNPQAEHNQWRLVKKL